MTDGVRHAPAPGAGWCCYPLLSVPPMSVRSGTDVARKPMISLTTFRSQIVGEGPSARKGRRRRCGVTHPSEPSLCR